MRARGRIIADNRITITKLMEELGLEVGDYWEGYILNGKIVIEFIKPKKEG